MSRVTNDLLSESRRQNWRVPDPIPYSLKAMLETLAEAVTLDVHRPKTGRAKQQAILEWAAGLAGSLGLTPGEVLYAFLRQENLLFAAGRRTVAGRRS